MAEIEAQQLTEVKQQEANKVVGLKTVENEREVAISSERAKQAIKEQEKITQEKIWRSFVSKR
ncbi:MULTISPECIES: hypothetical protein [Helicobacter]|uniref:DUF874 family protein n=1 Tax=Helicobacter mastomyrinus TaxID=287948 RepID=A0ABZ3F2L3_9HELI|nr:MULTISPECIES: hypothetical protein [Helicobacter]